MQDQALLESVGEIVILASDGINTALAELGSQSDEADYGAALETCQGSVETIAMAAEMAELDSLQQVCSVLTEHIGSVNGHASDFIKNHGQTLVDWSGAVLSYIQAPTDTELDDALLAPLPDELRVRILPAADLADIPLDDAANVSIADELPNERTVSEDDRSPNSADALLAGAEFQEAAVDEQEALETAVIESAEDVLETAIIEDEQDYFATAESLTEHAGLDIQADSQIIDPVPETAAVAETAEQLTNTPLAQEPEQPMIESGTELGAEPDAEPIVAQFAQDIDDFDPDDLDPDDLDLDDEDFAGALQEQLADTFAEFEPLQRLLANASNSDELSVASAAYGNLIERVQVAAEAVGLNGFVIVGELLNANVQALTSIGPSDRAAVVEALAQWPLQAQKYFNDPTETDHQTALVELLARPVWPMPVEHDQVDDLLAALAPADDEYLADAEQRPTVAQPEDVVLILGEDVNPKLVEVFMHESPLNAADFSAAVEQIIRGEDIVKNLGTAQRLAHNIKGSANLIGVKGIANMTHHIEDILEYLTEQQTAPQPALAHTLQEAADCVETMLESLQSGVAAPADAQRILQDVFDWANRMDAGQLEVPVAEIPTTAPAVDKAVDKAVDNVTEPEPSVSAALAEAPAPAAPPKPAESAPAAPESSAAPVAVGKVVRVPTETIDAMFQMVGEMSVALDQLQEHFETVRRHSNEVLNQNHMVQQRRFELENFIDVRHVANTQQRLRQLSQRDKDFDPLEMDQYDELYSTTRGFIESVVDSQRMSQQMRTELSSLERSLVPLQRMKDELQNVVMKTRMEPVSTIAARLQRSVRQACRTTGKQADLIIKGGDIQIDSEVLERLADPLMHMLRNAVDHGIEPAAERAANGKPETGTIQLSFFQEGQSVVVDCSDDGRGLDYEGIRSKAVAKGLLASGATMNQTELARLVLTSGFSTRDSATQLSGRGVGMDVVQSTIRDLKGIMDIGDAVNGGCQISLRLPITLLTNHSLVVRTGTERFAIPTSSIMQVLSPRRGRYIMMGDQMTYEIGQDMYPATTLNACLGRASDTDLPSDECSTVMVFSDAGPVAVAVDQLLKSYDLVVKSLGTYVGSVRGVAGLSTLADGSLIPVLDVAELLRAPVQASVSTAVTAQATVQRQVAAAQILIVDDSISVRQSLNELVEDAGYQPLLARDGIEAMEMLRKKTPDLVLSDIEMPRMNGLELASYIRTTHSADLPIIMITSRTMQKHRQQAVEAGANDYVTKPFDEDELLGKIRSYLQ